MDVKAAAVLSYPVPVTTCNLQNVLAMTAYYWCSKVYPKPCWNSQRLHNTATGLENELNNVKLFVYWQSTTTSCITLHGLKHRQDSYSFISFKGNICFVFFAFINLFLHLCSAIFSTFIHAHSCISKSNIAKFSIVCVCVCVDSRTTTGGSRCNMVSQQNSAPSWSVPMLTQTGWLRLCAAGGQGGETGLSLTLINTEGSGAAYCNCSLPHLKCSPPMYCLSPLCLVLHIFFPLGRFKWLTDFKLYFCNSISLSHHLLGNSLFFLTAYVPLTPSTSSHLHYILFYLDLKVIKCGLTWTLRQLFS